MDKVAVFVLKYIKLQYLYATLNVFSVSEEIIKRSSSAHLSPWRPKTAGKQR